jgi:hypothetical protein
MWQGLCVSPFKMLLQGHLALHMADVSPQHNVSTAELNA